MSFPFIVQDFVDAHKTTGIAATTGHWKRDDPVYCLCPLAVLACSKVGKDQFTARTRIYPTSVVTWDILGITQSESDAFVNGVDGCKWDNNNHYDPAIFNLGRQVRAAVFPELRDLPLAPV